MARLDLASRNIVAAIVGTIILNVVLLLASRPNETLEAANVFEDLGQRLIATEARRDLAILSLHFGLESDYDLLREIDAESATQLQVLQRELRHHAAPGLHARLERCALQIEQRRDLARTFATDNATRANSIRYFQRLSEETEPRLEAGTHASARKALHNVTHLLLDLLPSDPPPAAEAAQLIKSLQDAPVPPDLAENVRLIAAHAAFIVETQPRLAASLRESVQGTFAPTVQVLLREHRAQTVHETSFHAALKWSLCALTALLVVSASVLYRRTRELSDRLQLWNRELEDRIAVRTAELSGRNEDLVREIEQRRKAEGDRDRIFILAPELLCVIGFDGLFRRVNPAFESVLGYASAELLGQTCLQVVAPSHHEEVVHRMQGLAAGQHVHEFPVLAIAKSGEPVWILWNASPDLEAGQFFAYGRDVTEQRRAEEASRAATERFDLAVRASNDGIWDCNLETHAMFLSARFRELLHLPPDDGSPGLDPEGWLQSVHPDDRERVAAAFVRHLRGEATLDLELRHSVDGDLRWFRVRGLAVRDTGGKPVRLTGSLSDITEAKLRSEALREARDAAEQANRAKSEFLATMSHEIRTPLNGVLGFAEALLESPLDPTQREFAEIIRKSGDLLMVVINDVLDFSKIEAGRLELEQTAFQPGSVAAEAVQLLSARANEKQLALTCQTPVGPGPAFIGDPTRFRQILLNLAGNALKFTERGGVTIRIEFEENNTLHVRVTDTGVGIPADQLPRLFQKFTQADSSTTRRFGGTGLGLAISRRLVELMGGSIGVESTEGQGSTFWIRLPSAAPKPGTTPPFRASAASASDSDSPARPAIIRTPIGPQTETDARGAIPQPLPESAPARAGTATIPASSPDGQAPRILVAEDTLANQKLALHLLGKLGCQVDLARNGVEAVERFRRNTYALVLMDCHMPELDGFEATRQIREFEASPAARATSGPSRAPTPIIAFTAGVLAGEREQCLDAGMNDFLPKPVRADELRQTLARWLLQPAKAA